MVRLIVVVAVLALGVIVFRGRFQDAGGASAAPAVGAANVPAEFRSILADPPDPGSILRERGALPGLGAIRRLTGHTAEEAPPPPEPFADVGRPAELRKVRADIRAGLAALNHLSRGDGAAPAEVDRTLGEVYSAPVLAALGPDGRRAFAERVAGRTQAAHRVKVLDFQGVFVSGRRALAQVVYRISTRAASGRFVARAPARWTVTLALERGHWRFVRG
ncbi:MAG TPA: hypothetical protein VFG79_03225, partial [Solirubrobacter sp.]|nr:hypothetical protein [Solirubrobacter sp.]